MLPILKNRQLRINLLIGLGLISIPFLSSPDLNEGIKMLGVKGFQKSLFSYFLLTVFFYVNYYAIIPKLYITKQWWWFVTIMVLSYVMILKLPEMIIGDFGRPPLEPAFNNELPPPPPKRAENILLSFFSRDNYFFQFLGVLALSLFLRIDEHLNKIKSEKLATEVSYLKAQINPHFLFNTLNSLYALALTKSDKTPSAILKLSDLMRHAVTESNQNYIPLEKEIIYIKNFIGLQQLRLTNSTKLTTNFTGDFKNNTIAPMLLISIIENAFKYGANADDDSKILIDLNIDDNNLLTLNVENTVVNEKMASSEKGLKNTKKQLRILYPNKHQLTINREDNIHKVHLSIQLK